MLASLVLDIAVIGTRVSGGAIASITLASEQQAICGVSGTSAREWYGHRCTNKQRVGQLQLLIAASCKETDPDLKVRSVCESVKYIQLQA